MAFEEHRPPVEQALGSQGKSGHWWNEPAMVEKLKLTDAQRKSMDDVLLQHREKLVDLRGTLEKAELELEPMMSEEQPNEARILAQIDKVAQARAELEKANARFLLAIRGKLTPEQWKTLQAERANHRQNGEWDHRGQNQGGQGQSGQGQRGWTPGSQRRDGPRMGGQQAAPAQSAPQGAAPQGTGPQSAAPQGAPPQGRIEEDPGPQGAPPQGTEASGSMQ
jgi:Spy/CpxP family protein refolding chaperone